MTPRAYWDSQFKFSQVLPDFAGHLAHMSERSAAVAGPFTRQAYGPDPRQWVEWMDASGPQDVLPVILHGGYWRALEAETHRFMMPSFAPFGAAVANVEYRLMPGVRLADVVADVQAGLSCLAGAFGSAKLLLVGHSAGAHLALSAMSAPALAARTKGILALSGVYDLAPVPQCFLQDELKLTDAEVAAHSLRSTQERPPVLYVNGSAETHEFLRGAAQMAQAPNAGWHVIHGANHMTLTEAACAQAGDLLDLLSQLEDPS